MKRMMRNGNKFRRGVSLLLMMSLLITLLPTVSVADTTVGAYGSVTVTTKNVVIRSSPAGSRTGYFAQVGTYPMIGPVVKIDGVNWYNLQTSETSGYVSGTYATASYGSAGMPSTDKVYVDILSNTVLMAGTDPSSTTAATVTVAKGSILQLVDGDDPYSATVNSVTSDYINVYYNNTVYNVLYGYISKGIMTQDNLNAYITDVEWKATITESRSEGAKGDFLTHAMQAALYVLGYYDDDVDGFYGANTSAAVQKFKEDMINNGYSWTANGVAGSAIFDPLFDQAVDRIEYLRSTDGLSTTTGTTTTSYMIQTSVDKLRIRKSYTTSSAYVGVIPTAGTILTYTRTHVNGTTTWYYIQYDGTYGWVMGTYVTIYTTSTSTGTTTTSTITNWGTVTITKNLVAIRTSANGARSGYHVNKGDVCTLLGLGVEAGDYTWYHIRTENGREGYVRGDCCEVEYGSAGMPDSDATYVQFLYDGMSVTEGTPTTPGTVHAVAKNSVLQLVTGVAFYENSGDYIQVYYNNTVCFTSYSDNLINGLMSEDNVNRYIIDEVWAKAFGSTDLAGQATNASATIHTGDIRVQGIQAALYQLEYMDDDDDYDGMFGSVTAAAVKEFKSDYSVGTATSELVGTTVSAKLFTEAAAALDLKLSAASAEDTSDGTVLSAGDFGTFTTVKKGSWSEIDGGATSLFPKGSVATVMSVSTHKVFRLYRWSGANHADCVPYDTSDTATLCSILGVTYSSAKPTSSELALIKNAGNDDWPNYTWPKMRWNGTTYANAYKIPVWINLSGTVYCASIYVIPHGFTGTSSFSLSKLNGQYFYDRNNMYGMLCVHFYGSTTHASGKVDATHMSNINAAYNAAKTYSLFSGKVQ